MDMQWQELPPGSFNPDRGRAGVDPLFVWADGTGFRDFLRHDEKAPPEKVPVLCELADGRSMAQFAATVQALGGCIPQAYLDGQARTARYCTATFDARCFGEMTASAGREWLRRFEMQLPVIPLRPAPRADRSAKDNGHRKRPQRGETRPQAGETLIGVIDSGCPFAHGSFRAGGTTRLLAIWDQDPTPHYLKVGGRQPAGFDYGAEILRKDIDALVALHSPNGAANEDACYAEAGYPVPLQRMSHGAAVLDLLIGPRPLTARLSGEPDRPPTWKPADDDARRADVVFVDVPRDAVQDSSSGGLGRSILDGLRYICSWAGPETRRIVVNISNGTSRSTHDGTSIIEQAMAELVADHHDAECEMHVVIAAGNDRDEERHVQVDVGERTAPLRLRVPPGSEAPTWVTVRVPACAHGLSLRMRAPGAPDDAFSPEVRAGQACALFDKDAGAATASAGIVFAPPCDEAASTALIVIAPTERLGPGPRAAHGDWEIVLASPEASTGPVHLYISRNQVNPGALRRGQQARFVSGFEQYDPLRWRRKAEVDPVPAGSPVRRASTLNGLATYPPGQGLVVATGIESRLTPDGARQPVYASLGPSAGPAGTPSRKKPDAAAVTDAYRGLRGIVVAGSRSGSHVRVLGTSFAAPQVARGLADGENADASPARRRKG
jgi:hypothetical protein